jgi:hypothetical protein
MTPVSISMSTPKLLSASEISGLAAGWRDLYRAALFEADGAKLPHRIDQARAAVALRARELFNCAGDDFGEPQDLDDALYALQALYNCVVMDTRSVA